MSIWVRAHKADNVGTAMAPISQGTVIEIDESGATVYVRDVVPFGHKFALVPIGTGEPVIKYGVPIGFTIRDILAGEHVHVHNVEGKRGRGCVEVSNAEERLESRLLAAGQCLVGIHASGPHIQQTYGPGHPGQYTNLAAYGSRCSDIPLTFLGFARPDGRVGTRNHLLVIPTVVCASRVATEVARQVKGAIAVPHQHGCTQVGRDLQQTKRTLIGIGRNPNVGAVLVVGLGCEVVKADEIASDISRSGKPVEAIVIQSCGGSANAVLRGVDILNRLARQVFTQEREEFPVSFLVLGTECGGSDATSGLISNPVIGIVADLVVDSGGSVILSETTEFIGAEDLLIQRAVSPAIAERIMALTRQVEERAKQMGVDLRGSQPTPGNIEGGISTLEEKSLGCISKGGTSPVVNVVEYAEECTVRGLTIMDTPGQDIESVTGMVAGGATAVLFSTGRGTPCGCPIAPVIKVSASSYACQHMPDSIDFPIEIKWCTEAGREGLRTIAERLFLSLIDVASGTLTRSEILGHCEFAINRIGPSF